MRVLFDRRRMIASTLALGTTLMLRDVAGAQAGRATSLVEIGTGKIRGIRSEGISKYLGIRYGADTSEHRFQSAQPPEPWAGSRDCFTFGARAPQAEIHRFGQTDRTDANSPYVVFVNDFLVRVLSHNPESEDCLFLNVYTPEASHGSKRPVMVWLHPGGFSEEAGDDPLFDPTNLCRHHDVVVVTLNHRLNALGYLYLGGFSKDFADSGNVGQLDIILALKWVRDNIAAFGGDAGNVTIFGESGGGGKVGTLLGMPAAKGLFHKAIEQSGPMVTAVREEDAVAIAERTLATLQIQKRNFGRLRTIAFRKLIDAAYAQQPAHPTFFRRSIAPVVDGQSLPAHPFHPKATEISRDVPLIIGTTKDEWTYALCTDPDYGKMTEQQARERFTSALGPPLGAAAMDHFRSLRPRDPPTYWWSAMWTDVIMRTGSIVLADRKAAQQAAPVYMYRLDYETKLLDGGLRAPHGLDVTMVFDNVGKGVSLSDDSPAAHNVSRQMVRAWVNFARTGDPSHSALNWPRYQTAHRTTMLFGVESVAAVDPDRSGRLFWDKHPLPA